MGKNTYFLNVRLLRQLLIAADDIMHFAVAAVLIANREEADPVPAA